MAEWGFKTLEQKYGVTIESEGEWYHPLQRQWKKSYRIISADGCVWEKGLGSRAAVKREVLTWATELLRIKKNV